MVTEPPNHDSPSCFSNFKIMILCWPVVVWGGGRGNAFTLLSYHPWPWSFMMRPFAFSVSSSSMTPGDLKWYKASVPMYMLSVPSVCLDCLPLPSLSKLLLILQNKAQVSPSCTGKTVLSSRITWRAPPLVSVPSDFGHSQYR